MAAEQRPCFYKEIIFAPSVENPRRLVFIAALDAPKPPDELLLLRQDYERTARVVSVLFEDDERERKDIFLLLHEAADRGMRGTTFSIEDGRANLVEARETILDYAHNIRSKRLREYTLLLVVFGVIPLIVGAVVFLTSAFGWLSRPATGQPYDPLFAWILAAFWIPAGAAICVWGEFALRMQAGLSYEQLLNMDPSRWRPGQRLLITVGISFIFAFLLAYDAIQVGLGSMLLNDFAKKTPAMALAVGGVTGLAFAAVQDVIFRMKPAAK
ncbi:hypothetical protein ACVDG8_001750 [Mesorhizobium sp. ORM8.1]